MTTQRTLWPLALRIAGAMVLAIGLAHIAMPTHGYAPSVAAGLSAQEKAHFYDLATYAIASFLIAFGGMSLFLSYRRASLEAAAFSGLMLLVWAVRLGLELLYPVDFALFFVTEPHLGLIGALTALVILYAVATGRLIKTLTGRIAA